MKTSRHPICISDRLEALWVFCELNHEGQTSFLYELLGRMHDARFVGRPGLSYRTLTDDGLDFYDTLRRKYGQ